MKKYLFITLLFCACVFLFSTSGHAQASAPVKILRGGGKAAVIVVGSAAKVSWEFTKFAAGRVAKPVAKAIIVKGAPKAAMFMLKSTGLGAKYALPWVVKLSLL
jgi:hypothetical protein